MVVAVMATAVMASSPLDNDSNALRLAELESELNTPLSFMEVEAVHSEAQSPSTASQFAIIQAQWAKEDRSRKEARRARQAAEDAEEKEFLRKLKRKQRIAQLKARRASKAKDEANPGTSIDWDGHRYPPGELFDPKKKVVKKQSNGKPVYAKHNDGNCKGRCKKRFMRKHWPIVLDPSSVAAIDLPLLRELHARVNYLIEPQQKRMSIKESLLRSAARQVIDATEHHIRVYDFGEKHKNQLLVPQRIQDEQKIVQLE